MRLNYVTLRIWLLRECRELSLSDEASFARITFVATDNGVSTVSRETLAYHGSDRAGVQDLALGVNAARSDLRAWIDALSIEASSLRWTLVICLALFFNCEGNNG
jgi:hypothetical protein